MDPGRGGRALPGALPSHLVPAAAAGAKTTPSSGSANVIPRHPAGRVRSSSPTKGKPIKAPQPGVPTGRDPAEPAHRRGVLWPTQALSPRQVCADHIWQAARRARTGPGDPKGVSDPVAEQPRVLTVRPSLAAAFGRARSHRWRGEPAEPGGGRKAGAASVGVSVLQIFWPAPREQVEHCQLAGKNVEVSRACSPPAHGLLRFTTGILNTHITPKGSMGVCLREG